MPNNTPSLGRPSGKAGLVGWALFDWATQPYYTLVVTFLFAPYFVNGFMSDPPHAQSLWAFATSAAQLTAAVLAPVLGAIADAGLPRKPWIAVFSAMLILGSAVLWLAVPGSEGAVPLVLLSFGIATLGVELATQFNNAMMPGLISERRLGRLSGFAWAIGYAGGLVSLALVAGLLVTSPDGGKTLFGLTPLVTLDSATREGDRLVGPFCAVWYLVFVLPMFLFTQDRHGTRPANNPVPEGLRRLVSSIRNLLRAHRNVALFLLARMLYADGCAAVFSFGAIYAASVFGWGATELGLFGIILTVAALVGACIGGLVDDAVGSKTVIVVGLLVFIVGSIGVLSVDPDEIFFVVPVAEKPAGGGLFAAAGEQVLLAFALLIGIALGPVQASSRTLLARICPSDQTTEFYGFFAFSGKVTAFAAPLAIGIVTAVTGSQRLGISVSLVFLIAGLLLLAPVRATR
ncbi:MFS transporter [Methyloceanibacter methanicus]|uniref:MFS transporter n=1 Tax=Methyloceanibacter methanicus TaxID=1774968 RepID=A0A1E3W6L4_9HYPH|nr:MFS transporter [Methyloceanibacter methanicus]